MNELVKEGTAAGVPLALNTLGIGNGIIDAATQFPFVCSGAVIDPDSYTLTVVVSQVCG